MPVLMYHDLIPSDNGNLNNWTVTTDKFREDMQWLQDNGYATDLETSVERIETNVGAAVTYFAHPHGQKDAWSDAFVKELFPVTATSEVATANLVGGTQDLPRYNISMSTPLSQHLD